MTGRFFFVDFSFGGKIRMKKCRKNNGKRNKRYPNCTARNYAAENRADNGAGKKAEQHIKMLDKLFPVFRNNGAAVAKLAREPHADLPNMIRCKRCCHRHALRLAERVVLH